MPQKTRRRKIPRAEDKLVDWEFRRIIHTVENVIEFIRKKNVLRDPDDRRRRLLGFLTEGHTGIYVSHDKQNPPAKNLIHEALHALYRFPTNSCVNHRAIFQKEEILWTRFTDSQKRFLRQFIPKHESRHNPQ